MRAGLPFRGTLTDWRDRLGDFMKSKTDKCSLLHLIRMTLTDMRETDTLEIALKRSRNDLRFLVGRHGQIMHHPSVCSVTEEGQKYPGLNSYGKSQENDCPFYLIC